MQSSISCMWNLFVMSRRFAWISFAEARKFLRFFQRAPAGRPWFFILTLSTHNERTQLACQFPGSSSVRLAWWNTKFKRFGITAVTATGWGQEEGTDEDTAVEKEGVRPLMKAQKGKNNILFERLFSRNKKINALTEVKEDQYLKEGVCVSGRKVNFL